jgi:hypothetical protein
MSGISSMRKSRYEDTGISLDTRKRSVSDVVMGKAELKATHVRLQQGQRCFDAEDWEAKLSRQVSHMVKHLQGQQIIERGSHVQIMQFLLISSSAVGDCRGAKRVFEVRTVK